jgi:hypothetical protein
MAGDGAWATVKNRIGQIAIPAAIVGLVVMRRRRIPIFPFLAVAAALTITVAMSFGITRYRAPVDAVLPVLAAVGIDAALRRWWRRHEAPPGAAEPTPEPALPAPVDEPVSS